jgi:hypothetical protein
VSAPHVVTVEPAPERPSRESLLNLLRRGVAYMPTGDAPALHNSAPFRNRWASEVRAALEAEQRAEIVEREAGDSIADLRRVPVQDVGDIRSFAKRISQPWPRSGGQR